MTRPYRVPKPGEIPLRNLRALCGGTEIYWIACVWRVGLLYEGANLVRLLTQGPDSKVVFDPWMKKGYIVKVKGKLEILLTSDGVDFMNEIITSDVWKNHFRKKTGR